MEQSEQTVDNLANQLCAYEIELACTEQKVLIIKTLPTR